MTEGLIGVIVPVYKVEKYIAECIESILAQTYTNFRLILVNDGTPDNAGNICDEYAKKDSRITVIHQENAGVTRARARGVEEASDCEWITFVDGDDTIDTNAFEILISYSGSNTDIIVSTQCQSTNKFLEHIDIINYRCSIITGQNCAPWGKLFNRELFTPDVFSTPKEIIVGEDLIMNLLVSFRTNKNVIFTGKGIYNYRFNDNSVSNTFKQSLDYEIIFHKALTNVLSDYNNIKYTHAHIKRRLITWNNAFGYSYNTPAWHGTDYHKEIINDIKTYRYPISFIERLLLKHKSISIRFILINIRKLNNLVWRF